MVIAAVAAALFFYTRRPAPGLSEKDTIVIADFVNSTGDPVFEDALKQAEVRELSVTVRRLRPALPICA